ncbi:MAG: Heavy metal translocating P-type ATPase [uncultured bacterium]|nr:MAG: Heavy metal translocating P-type ATPase [uncultured bacterium]HBG19919.1 cadmium-translocating P-type ATPase [Desulfobulbaceae bacterium]
MKLQHYKTIVNNELERPHCQDACCASKGEAVITESCGCQSCTATIDTAAIDGLLNKIEEGFRRTVFRVSGMDCGDCAAKLEKRLASMSGVRSATINFGAGKLTIDHAIADSAIVQAVKHAGYGAIKEAHARHQPVTETNWWKNSRTLSTLVSGILLAIATALDWFGITGNIVVLSYALTAVIGGFHAAKSGLYSLRSLSLDMNFLMTVAIIGAAAIGEWSEGAAVAFLFSFGNTLQAYTLDKTRQSIRSLMELAPSEALVKRGKEEKRLPVEDIVVGDIVIIKPGERIAMDGVVLSGISAVDQATITGESIPVEKIAGDTVYAGTMNVHGALEITVTKNADNSTLAKISHLVEEAQAQKAPSQQFVDVFAKYYTPLVLVAAAGVIVLPTLFFDQPFAPWFYNGLVLLVISCPCALVISTPVSIVSAIGNASRHGVLIKGGAYLEQMGSINAIAFDKTGTLTHGRPVVTDIVTTNGFSETELLEMAAGIEKWSEHPVARAVVERAKGLELKAATHFKALVGRGAQAEIDGQLIYIGNLRLFEDLGYDLTHHGKTLADFERQGKTVMLAGTQKRILGLIAVADTLREDSGKAITALHKAGMKHVAMLTGDNSRVASAIAQKLDLDTFYSELLPADKVSVIKTMVRDYGKVVMVGDGVNDAPAMAVATVGVAMGVAGSDVALETADVALMNDDLSKLAYVVKLSHKTVAIIKQNIAFSISIKVVFLLLLFLGMANLWLAVLADMGASLLVTLNGMRLMAPITVSLNKAEGWTGS